MKVMRMLGVAMVFGMMLIGSAFAQDTNVTAMLDSATTTFGSVRTFILLVVGFFITLGIVLWYRRKR